MPTAIAHSPLTLRHQRPNQQPGALPQTAGTARQPATGLDSFGIVPNSRGFVALLEAYRHTGGTTRGDDLAGLLEDRDQGDLVSLAKHIVAGEVFGFEWHHTFWVPMFQFRLTDLSVNPGVGQVLAEFSEALDGWSLAAWFVTPSPWLGGRQPADCIDTDLYEVLQAARADRFVAAG